MRQGSIKDLSTLPVGRLGIMPLEKLPDWAKEGLANIQKETRKQKDRGAR